MTAYTKTTVRLTGLTRGIDYADSERVPPEVTIWRVDNSRGGAPRYVVHHLELSTLTHLELEDVQAVLGIDRYRAKWFGAGLVFTSFNPQETLEDFYRRIVVAAESAQL